MTTNQIPYQMGMISDYEKFCKLSVEGRVSPDVSSNLGHQSVEYLRKKGWKIRGGLFRKSKTTEDLLSICRESEENFKMAVYNAGIDFWETDD